jgi:hypothetical protein
MFLDDISRDLLALIVFRESLFQFGAEHVIESSIKLGFRVLLMLFNVIFKGCRSAEPIKALIHYISVLYVSTDIGCRWSLIHTGRISLPRE